MPDKSSYLRYLPPVLWEKEPPAPHFSLGAMLRVFEKILTGLDDAEVVVHGDHAHEPIEVVIARLHRLFDPWTTPPEFLDWLASWVSLRFPALWDEYARRKVTSEIVQIYRRRGLKEGLDQYLDLYTVESKRPRIVLDDCSKVLMAVPEAEKLVPIHTLMAHGPAVRFDSVTGTFIQAHEGLIEPLCMTRAPDQSLLVGDAGTPGGWSPVVDEGVWRLPPPGRYDFRGTPPRPQRLGPGGWNLEFPVALVTDNAAPWHLYVLDRVVLAATTALYELTSPGFGAAVAVATKAVLGTIWPVAMALDTNGHLLILDRGAPPANVSAPKIIDVQLAPLVVSSRNLLQVLEPLALLVQPNGDLIIGDGREQNLPVPGDLVRVDRSNNLNWVETRLLAPLAAAQNPLVAPVAVVRQDATQVYVADIGLKPLMPVLANPFIRVMAEPAAVYRVDIGAAPPVVTRATETRQLVFPTGMVLDAGTLYICDRGEYADPVMAGALLRVWRARSHEFGVVVHFSSQRPTTQQERRQIVQNIYQIAAEESPAHAWPTLIYSV